MTNPAANPVAEVAETLMGEYSQHLSPATVSSIVLAAHQELQGQVPAAAHPELLYRLAKERLHT